MNPTDVLERYYSISIEKVKSGSIEKINNEIIENVDQLIKYIESNKSLVSSIVTSLAKKIINPDQDVRLHRTDFTHGYSARAFDTVYTTPFFKKYFPKYANKETSFLTLATRERIKWNLKEGLNLKIRKIDLKKSFLQILDNIQKNPKLASSYLTYIFSKLIVLSQKDEKIFISTNAELKKISIVNINVIINMLSEHFNLRRSSRLPVIAIYTIYQELLRTVKRYSGKHLLPLNVHTSSDKKGFGDVEVYNKDESPFEIVEVKHNIPIDTFMIFDIVKKTKDLLTNRYYILTTYEGCFKTDDDESAVHDLIFKIKRDKGLEIIPNGITNSLKYYLRFVDNYDNFVKQYIFNLFIFLLIRRKLCQTQ